MCILRVGVYANGVTFKDSALAPGAHTNTTNLIGRRAGAADDGYSGREVYGCRVQRLKQFVAAILRQQRA